MRGDDVRPGARQRPCEARPAAGVLRAHAVRDEGRPRAREGPFRRRLRAGHRSGDRRCRAAVRPRGRGAGRRDHPQADVRAAAAVRLRRGGPLHGQRQRVLRAGDPARHPALEHRAPARRGILAAVRRRALARHALPAQAGGRPAPRPRGRRPGGARRAAARGAHAHDGQPAVPDAHRPGAARHERAGHRAVPRAGRGRHGAAETPRRGATVGRPRRHARRAGRTGRPRRHRGRPGDRPAASRIWPSKPGAPRWTSSPPCPRFVRRTPQIREKHAFALNRHRPTRRGRGDPAGVDRRARPGQRDLRPARPGLQGPVAGRVGARTDPARRGAARQGDRGLSGRVRGRLARPLPGHQRGAADAPARPDGHRGSPRSSRWSATARGRRSCGTMPTSGTTPPSSSWR